MIWLIAAASQLASANLCLPPRNLGEVVRIGKMGDRDFWVYGVRKGKELRMLTRVSCSIDERPLTVILDEDDRIFGKGAINLRVDRRLPERAGCNDSVGYIDRNGHGGFEAAVYGRIGSVVATLRVDTGALSERTRLVSIIEGFRTHLLGCPVSVAE